MASSEVLARIARLRISIAWATALGILCIHGAAGASLNIDSVRFVAPTDGLLRYHLAVDVKNGVGETVTLTSAVVDDEAQETFAVLGSLGAPLPLTCT